MTEEYNIYTTCYTIHIGKYIIRKRAGRYWEAVDGFSGEICFGGSYNLRGVDGEHLLQVLKAVVLEEGLDSEEVKKGD